jgi:hypothetical protein
MKTARVLFAVLVLCLAFLVPSSTQASLRAASGHPGVGGRAHFNPRTGRQLKTTTCYVYCYDGTYAYTITATDGDCLNFCESFCHGPCTFTPYIGSPETPRNPV